MKEYNHLYSVKSVPSRGSLHGNLDLELGGKASGYICIMWSLILLEWGEGEIRKLIIFFKADEPREI